MLKARDQAQAQAQNASLPRLIDFNDDASYWALYNRIYDHPQEATGHQIQIQGFVYRESSWPAGEFLVARQLMWCCAADMGIVGFRVQAQGQVIPAESQWVEVRGELTVGKGEAGEIIPVIQDATYANAEMVFSKVIYP
jgi:putative membrane protein